MLDWDKPLSQQAGAIGQFAQTMVSKNPDPVSRAESWLVQAGDRVINAYPTKREAAEAAATMTGADFWRHLDAAGARRGADTLRQQGIPGIRYLDQGSRGTGQGTSNFVVFPGEEDLLRILERNGVPIQSLLD